MSTATDVPPTIESVKAMVTEYLQLQQGIQIASLRQYEIAEALRSFASAIDAYVDDDKAEFVVRGNHVEVVGRRVTINRIQVY